MSLLDRFKKQPASAKSSGEAKPEARPEKKVVNEKQPEKKPEKKVIPKKISTKGDAPLVLIKPHVTEKATDLEKENKYVFKVFKTSNKIEIKKAVESLYTVNVENVRIINVPRKKRRIGKSREGWRKGYKKAIVKLAKGQKIEIMPR